MTATIAPVQVPQRDIAIWRGDDDPAVVWEFGDDTLPEILRGSVFLLIVQWPDHQIELRTDAAGSTLVMDDAARTVTWAYTITESSELPLAPARYELKRVIAGKTRTWVWGVLKVSSGLFRV